MSDNHHAKEDGQIETAGKLELLEERAHVVKDVIIAGKVSIQKHVRTKVVNVPVHLEETYLSIQINRGDSATQAMLAGDYDDKDVIATFADSVANVVTLNGEVLSVDEPVEIILSRQTAVVSKKTYVVEEVALTTYTDTQKHTLATQLQKEVLDIEGKDYSS